MKIMIRKAKLEDAKLIAELHKKAVNEVNSKFYSAEAVREWIKDISEENVVNQLQKSDWIVAEINRKIVGFGQYSITNGEVYQINVDSDFLNQEIGRKLYGYIENNFRKIGKEKISLNSSLNAVEFYQKLGFVSAGEIFIGLVKMIKMEKSLRTQE